MKNSSIDLVGGVSDALKLPESSNSGLSDKGVVLYSSTLGLYREDSGQSSVVVPYSLDPFVFTTTGKTGRLGPTDQEFATAYSGTNLDSPIFSSANGFQYFTVPVSGVWQVMCRACGYDMTSIGLGAVGKPAQVTMTVRLQRGTLLRILCGQGGLVHKTSPANYWFPCAAGASFVMLDSGKILAVAGGGCRYDNGRADLANPGNPTSSSSTYILGSTTASGGASLLVAGGAPTGATAAQSLLSTAVGSQCTLTGLTDMMDGGFGGGGSSSHRYGVSSAWGGSGGYHGGNAGYNDAGTTNTAGTSYALGLDDPIVLSRSAEVYQITQATPEPSIIHGQVELAFISV